MAEPSMVDDFIVIYRIHETILILILKRYFSDPKTQYLTAKFVLKFKEAL